MFVVQVIPLVKTTKIENLSYFSRTNYEVGTFLEVPIRKKNYFAMVVKSEPVDDLKADLRKADFALKKLPEQKFQSLIPESLRKLAKELTKIYPTSTGQTLYQLIPSDIRNGSYKYPLVSSLTHKEETTPQILSDTTKNRFITYRSYIRSIMARRGSVLFVVPSSAHIAYAKKCLSKGIGDRLVVFSPLQSKKDRFKSYEAFEDTTISKVIITTPAFAYLDRVDLLSIIIENSASSLYKNRKKPYIDHKVALTELAKITGRELLLGDILPKAEDEHFRRLDFFITHGEETKRITFPTPFSIIKQKDKPTSEEPFSLFSPTLKKRIENSIAARERIFLFGARRGLAPAVACNDCGHIFRCPDSLTPYSLLRTFRKSDGGEERWFVSSVSGRRERAADLCPTCGSWRLGERGIGIQQVLNECESLFPQTKILLADSTTLTTAAKAKKIIADFYENRSIILIGTPIIIPFLFEKGVDLSAVISFDATRSNPTWRADEDTFRLLLQLREISHKELLVQTRFEADDLLNYAKQGNLESFYNDQLELRKNLEYPPFSQFVLLSFMGKKDVVNETEQKIKLLTQKYPGTFYSNPLSTPEKTLRYALFRFEPKPDEIQNFINLIRELPAFIKIEIDPNRIV